MDFERQQLVYAKNLIEAAENGYDIHSTIIQNDECWIIAEVEIKPLRRRRDTKEKLYQIEYYCLPVDEVDIQ